MALSLSVNTPQMVNGSYIAATYWRITSVQVDMIALKCTLLISGYADKASHDADANSCLLQHECSFPSPNTTQFPFDPTYMNANFSSYGTTAYLMAAQAFCLTDAFFSGATQVA
jgi:hypothetical protein